MDWTFDMQFYEDIIRQTHAVPIQFVNGKDSEILTQFMSSYKNYIYQIAMNRNIFFMTTTRLHVCLR